MNENPEDAKFKPPGDLILFGGFLFFKKEMNNDGFVKNRN